MRQTKLDWAKPEMERMILKGVVKIFQKPSLPAPYMGEMFFLMASAGLAFGSEGWICLMGRKYF